MSSRTNDNNPYNDAAQVVIERIDELDSLATKFKNDLNTALTDLSTITVAPVDEPVLLQQPTLPTPSVDTTGAPTLDNIPPINFSPLPELGAIDSLLTELQLDPFQEIAPPELPQLNMPISPEFVMPPMPARPSGLDDELPLPENPIVDMPEIGQLREITLPEFQFAELPTFDEIAPDTSTISLPKSTIDYTEQSDDADIQEVRSRIMAILGGANGLSALAEKGIFDRAVERVQQEVNRDIQAAHNEWASRGFGMPPGMLVKAVNVAKEQGELRKADTNRDVVVEANRRELEIFNNAMGQLVDITRLAVDSRNNVQNRLLDVAKSQLDADLSLFNAQVSLFNAQNASFQTLADVYRTKLDGAISRITAYKAQIDAQLAIGQINQQEVDIYKAKFEGVRANVDVFKALMEGASLRSEAIKNKLEAYRVDVQAYAEQLNFEKTKFDVYDTQIKAESTKTELFDAQARAYASQVQAAIGAYSSNADVQVRNGQLKLEAARVKIAEYQARTENYRTEVQANVSVAQNNTQVFQAKVEAWRAKSSTDVANAEMQSRFADSVARTNIAFAEMQISQYSAKMQNAVQQAQIALEAAKAAGQYTAQLAAGAMSAANISASISGSTSISDSYSKSDSTSESTNYNYSY